MDLVTTGVSAWAAIVLGLVQGLTEFLPVSSSAHLRIVGDLLGVGDPGAAFTAIIQLGTESAVVLYFRRDIARICVAWWRAVRGADGTDRAARFGSHDPDARMGWYIGLGSLPIIVLGLIFQNSIENTFRNLYLIAFTLAGFALVLGWADRRAALVRSLGDLTPRHTVIFGFAQALALIPGVSRSGGTITAGLLLGYTREAAARYSFLLAIPAVVGSASLEAVTKVGDLTAPGGTGILATVIATIIAFVVGYAVIVWFLKIITTRSFMPFVIYRLGFAAVIVVLVATGTIAAN